jgi:hypothetical protein
MFPFNKFRDWLFDSPWTLLKSIIIGLFIFSLFFVVIILGAEDYRKTKELENLFPIDEITIRCNDRPESFQNIRNHRNITSENSNGRKIYTFYNKDGSIKHRVKVTLEPCLE